MEFTPEQGRTFTQLSTVLKLAGAALIGVGALRLVAGVYTLLFVDNIGLLHIIEALPMVILGLVLSAASSSTRYIVETKYGVFHTGIVLRDLATFYKILGGVAMLFTFFLLLWAIFG